MAHNIHNNNSDNIATTGASNTASTHSSSTHNNKGNSQSNKAHYMDHDAQSSIRHQQKSTDSNELDLYPERTFKVSSSQRNQIIKSDAAKSELVNTNASLADHGAMDTPVDHLSRGNKTPIKPTRRSKLLNLLTTTKQSTGNDELSQQQQQPLDNNNTNDTQSKNNKQQDGSKNSTQTQRPPLARGESDDELAAVFDSDELDEPKRIDRNKENQETDKNKLALRESQRPPTFGSTPTIVRGTYVAPHNERTFIERPLVRRNLWPSNPAPARNKYSLISSSSDELNSSATPTKKLYQASIYNNQNNNSDTFKRHSSSNFADSNIYSDTNLVSSYSNLSNVRRRDPTGPTGYSNISNLFPNRPYSSLRVSRVQPVPDPASQAKTSLWSTSSMAQRQYSDNIRKQSKSNNNGNNIQATVTQHRPRTATITRYPVRSSSAGLSSATPSPVNRTLGSSGSSRVTTPVANSTGTSPVTGQRSRSLTRSLAGGATLTRRPSASRVPSSGSYTYRRSPSLASIPTARTILYDPECPIHGTYLSYQNLADEPVRQPYLLHSPVSGTSSRHSLLQSPSSGAPLRSLHPTTPSPTDQSAEQLRTRVFGSSPASRPQPVHLHPQWAYTRPFVHLHQGPARGPQLSPMDTDMLNADIRPEFVAVHRLDDNQVVRSIDFHPNGEVYAVGSNSRTLRICSYPADHELRHLSPQHVATQPRVLFKFLQVHRGSIYCVGFNANGDLLATGSNDQTIHVVRYNATTHCPEGEEYKLTMHDGTVRDLCFIDDISNGSSLLISAGGGNNKIYVTDCDTITPFQSLTGHTSTVLSLHTWGGANFVSGSADRTIRFWDLRTRGCTSIVSAPSSASPASKGPGAPVNVVRVDPTGKLLVSGHTDSTCMLYDIRAARVIQTFKSHYDEIRTISFSPKSYYLLTAGYDARVVLTDLQGDLTLPLPSVCVAEHSDKIVQAKWHPTDFTFVTTSADKTATLWALPQ